jgi:hypothetical protein
MPKTRQRDRRRATSFFIGFLHPFQYIIGHNRSMICTNYFTPAESFASTENVTIIFGEEIKILLLIGRGFRTGQYSVGSGCLNGRNRI